MSFRFLKKEVSKAMKEGDEFFRFDSSLCVTRGHSSNPFKHIN